MVTEKTSIEPFELLTPIPPLEIKLQSSLLPVEDIKVETLESLHKTLESLHEKIKSLEGRLEELEDKALRFRADFENLQTAMTLHC